MFYFAVLVTFSPSAFVAFLAWKKMKKERKRKMVRVIVNEGVGEAKSLHMRTMGFSMQTRSRCTSWTNTECSSGTKSKIATRENEAEFFASDRKWRM